MATINFYLDTRATGYDKPAPLKISIRHRNKATFIPTGISLLPEQWDDITRKVVNHPRKVAFNNILAHRILDVESEELHLSKRAKAYHPGQGVYRSSYKNARRLTATETNMAYRSADYEHRQALDFVVGIKIQLSNNHTLNGEPFVDICDHLAGNYPKDFKFVGWHPLCRCLVANIFKTKDESNEDIARMLRGEAPIPPEQSKNYVGDTPDQFKAWCTLNAGRVERAKSLPYFIRDNKGYYDAALNPKKAEELTPLEIAKYRHEQRTPEQIESIKNRWRKRQEERNTDFKPWTDEKAKAKFASWMRSNGVNISDNDIVVDNGFIHLQDDQHRYIYESHNYETQAEHDQLWAHQGRGRYKNSGYVQTGNSWQINNDFRKTKVIGNIDAIAEAKLRANGASDDDIKTIKLLDKKIDEHSLPVPMIVTRYVDVSALKSIFGFRIKKGDFNYILSQLSGVPSGAALMPDPAYMSASTNELQNVFVNQYDVKLMIEIPPKTPMYFTNNYPESEVILGRATNLQYLSSSIGYTGHKAHIVIRCRVVR